MAKTYMKALLPALCLSAVLTACGRSGGGGCAGEPEVTGTDTMSAVTPVDTETSAESSKEISAESSKEISAESSTVTPAENLAGTDNPDTSETVEYEGEYYLKSEISKETLKWLEGYHQLSEEGRLKISAVPHEFVKPGLASAVETDDVPTDDVPTVDLFLTSPPEVTLSDPLSSSISGSGNNMFQLRSDNYNWSVQDKKDVLETVACGAHPLDSIMEKQERMKVTQYNKMDATSYFFSCVIPPDTITVTAWNAASLGNMEAKAESVKTYENARLIKLQPGKVYELTAEWSREKLEKRRFSGTASYTLITE